jgi:hypothetical protein
MRMDFAPALREAVAVLISGALARLPR